MSTQTTHYNLTKPAGSDNVDIQTINNNYDTIDTAIYNANQAINSISPASINAVGPRGTTTWNIPINASVGWYKIGTIENHHTAMIEVTSTQYSEARGHLLIYYNYHSDPTSDNGPTIIWMGSDYSLCIDYFRLASSGNGQTNSERLDIEAHLSSTDPAHGHKLEFTSMYPDSGMTLVSPSASTNTYSIRETRAETGICVGGSVKVGSSISLNGRDGNVWSTNLISSSNCFVGGYITVGADISYGTGDPPAAGNPGRIYFKKVSV